MGEIFKDFQSTLKEVLKDDGSAEQAMQSMEQMMSFIKQNIDGENEQQQAVPPTSSSD